MKNEQSVNYSLSLSQMTSKIYPSLQTLDVLSLSRIFIKILSQKFVFVSKRIESYFYSYAHCLSCWQTFPLSFVITPFRQREINYSSEAVFSQKSVFPASRRGGDYKDFTRSTRGCIVLSLHSSEILSLLMILVLGLQWRYTEIINLSPFL